MLKRLETRIESIIFASRWLQTPLYLGMIVVQLVYAYKFLEELLHLVMHAHTLSEVDFMQVVLSLIDILMIANLIVMVVIGGYVTFVSQMELHEHEDRPDWLEHIDPGALKLKLAGALVGISGVNLLRTFGQLSTGSLTMPESRVLLMALIHIIFVVSTVLLAWGELILAKKHAH